MGGLFHPPDPPDTPECDHPHVEPLLDGTTHGRCTTCGEVGFELADPFVNMQSEEEARTQYVILILDNGESYEDHEVNFVRIQARHIEEFLRAYSMFHSHGGEIGRAVHIVWAGKRRPYTMEEYCLERGVYALPKGFELSSLSTEMFDALFGALRESAEPACKRRFTKELKKRIARHEPQD